MEFEVKLLPPTLNVYPNKNMFPMGYFIKTISLKIINYQNNQKKITILYKRYKRRQNKTNQQQLRRRKGKKVIIS